MKHYLLFYDVNEDYLAQRPKYRNAHLTKAWAAHERGELLLGGALAEPPDGAVLLFAGGSPAVAEAFARADPYVVNVREWVTVAGDAAATPVHPDTLEDAGGL
jgi:hypothetical protein